MKSHIIRRAVNGTGMFRSFTTVASRSVDLTPVSATATSKIVSPHDDKSQDSCPFQHQQKDKHKHSKPEPEVQDRSVKPFSDIPMPKGLPLFGTYLEYLRNGGGKNLHNFTLKRHQRLGPIYKEKTGVTHAVFLGDPVTFRDMTLNEGNVPVPFVPPPINLYLKTHDKKRGLFFMLGDEWIQNRRVMNNFLLKKLDYHDLHDYEENLRSEVFNKWHLISQRNGGLVPHIEKKIHEEGLGTLASFFMGKIFGSKYASDLSSDAEEFYNNSKNHWDAVMKMQVIPAEIAKKYGLPVWKRFDHSATEMLNLGYKWMSIVKDNLGSPESDGFIQRVVTKEPNLDYDVLSRVLVDFVFTSENEALTKAWSIYTIARNPEIQDKLFDEIQRVCGKGEKLSSRHLDSTPLLRACVFETTRLFPVSLMTVRFTEKEAVIGGYQIPSGSFVAMNVYACQRDPKFFPNPDKFWPERWFRKKLVSKEDAGSDIWDLDAEQTGIDRYIGVNGSAAHPHMTFGWGLTATRSCIFRKVSLVRLNLFLGRLVQEFHLKCDPVQPTMRSLLLPDKDMNLRIAKRP